MILKNCNVNEFVKGLKGRKVICFGAGTVLTEGDYDNQKIDELHNHIAFFVDNSEEKHGLKYLYRGMEYDIKNPRVLNSIDSEKYVILITCMYYVEIYMQLEEMPGLKDVECYMYNCICSNPELDINQFFSVEINKRPYKEWKTILRGLNLRDKHKGERCFIIGNGPRLKAEDLELLKDEVTFAANRIHNIYAQTTWRPTYYCCIDFRAYALKQEDTSFVEAGMRFVPLERTLAAGKITYYNRKTNYTKVLNGAVVNTDRYDFSEDVETVVYGADTVLYDMFQFAVYMGFKEIYLLGVDNCYKKEVRRDGIEIEHTMKRSYFSEKYEAEVDKISSMSVPVYAMENAYICAKEVCDKNGITVKNATRGGNLEVFERIQLEDLLNYGGDRCKK